MFDIFLGNRRVFIGRLPVNEIVGIAIPYLAVQIEVTEISQRSFGKGHVSWVDVASSPHPVHEADAGSEHGRATKEIGVRPHRLAHGFHGETETLHTGDRGVKGLDPFGFFILGQSVVL